MESLLCWGYLINHPSFQSFLCLWVNKNCCISTKKINQLTFFALIWIILIRNDNAGRKTVAGSAAGGLKETQEMIDFAAKHNIRPEIEVISMNYVNIAMERLAKGDVKYRFVIDIENTLAATKS